eukprot:1186743-Prorocentrum_minimum.AAC.3
MARARATSACCLFFLISFSLSKPSSLSESESSFPSFSAFLCSACLFLMESFCEGESRASIDDRKRSTRSDRGSIIRRSINELINESINSRGRLARRPNRSLRCAPHRKPSAHSVATSDGSGFPGDDSGFPGDGSGFAAAVRGSPAAVQGSPAAVQGSPACAPLDRDLRAGPYNPTTLQPDNPTTLQLYNSTTLQLYNPTTQQP